MTTFTSTYPASWKYNPTTIPGNLIHAACATALAARQRFLDRHGPGASLPPRPALSKEIRKAQLAAEMARWECF